MKNYRTICMLTTMFFSSILISCGNSNPQKNSNTQDSIEKDEYSFIKKIKIKELPIIDSTNFDNYEAKSFLSKNEIEILKLSKIIPDNNVEIALNYQIKISENFKTLVFSFYPSENEITTILVNYDKDYKIIDSRIIAYDEIAESWLRTTSKIEKNNLKIIENNCSSGQDIETISNYVINETGEIKASH